MNGLVFDIEKFAIHDGPGIRTTIFLKGCPLRCLWCHNPESQDAGAEILFTPEKCIGCGECIAVCPNHCIHRGDFDRSHCVRCGKCIEKCFTGARELIGKSMRVDDVLTEVLKDKLFYKTSGGGITLSGGEPMFQFQFTLELLRQAKAADLHTCMETCGFAPVEHYAETLPYVDIYLFDIKETNLKRHQEYTGVSLEPILDNLQKLDESSAQIILRCPIIPGLNQRNEHAVGIVKIAKSLMRLQTIHLLPYHPLGNVKSVRIGRTASLMSDKFPDKAEMEKFKQTVSGQCIVPVELN